MLKVYEAHRIVLPYFAECATEAEKMYQRHKHQLVDVVYEVLKKMVKSRVTPNIPEETSQLVRPPM